MEVFEEHGIYPALAFVLAAVLIGYRYRHEKKMPCSRYVTYHYAAYIVLFLTVLFLFLLNAYRIAVPYLASAFTLGFAGALYLAERSYYYLVCYLREQGRHEYDGRPLWIYRFYLWSMRAVFPFVLLAALMLPFL